MKRPWIAFFSQTGSEIADIIKSTGREPDLIVTNERPSALRTIDKRIKGGVMLPNKPSLAEYREVLKDFDNPIITLHGWLRVVPSEICAEYEIYNGHPGLITEYPELKGKDPQQRAYFGIQTGKYRIAGAVIHKVVPEVDEGEILEQESFGIKDKLSLDELFRILKEVSLDMWVKFLKKVL